MTDFLCSNCLFFVVVVDDVFVSGQLKKAHQLALFKFHTVVILSYFGKIKRKKESTIRSLFVVANATCF